jgi:hypothetical protein
VSEECAELRHEPAPACSVRCDEAEATVLTNNPTFWSCQRFFANRLLPNGQRPVLDPAAQGYALVNVKGRASACPCVFPFAESFRCKGRIYDISCVLRNNGREVSVFLYQRARCAVFAMVSGGRVGFKLARFLQLPTAASTWMRMHGWRN